MVRANCFGSRTKELLPELGENQHGDPDASNEKVLGEGVVDCKDHLDIQHKVCGRMGKKGYRAERVSVSTWKENVTKKVGFGFMGIKQSHVGLCTLVRPLHLCFLV